LWKPKHIFGRKYSFIHSQTIQETYLNSYQFSQWIWVSKIASDEKVLGFAHLQPHRTKKSKIERRRGGGWWGKSEQTTERGEEAWWGKCEQTTDRGESGCNLREKMKLGEWGFNKQNKPFIPRLELGLKLETESVRSGLIQSVSDFWNRNRIRFLFLIF